MCLLYTVVILKWHFHIIRRCVCNFVFRLNWPLANSYNTKTIQTKTFVLHVWLLPYFVSLLILHDTFVVFPAPNCIWRIKVTLESRKHKLYFGPYINQVSSKCRVCNTWKCDIITNYERLLTHYFHHFKIHTFSIIIYE